MFIKIRPTFWSDPEIEKLTCEQKLAALWIMTNPHRNPCGYSQVSLRRFSFETGLKEEVLAQVVAAMPQSFKFYPEISVVYARNSIRHQFGEGTQLTKNNIFKTILRAFCSCPFPDVKHDLAEDYVELKDSLCIDLEPFEEVHDPSPTTGEALTKPLPSPSQGLTKSLHTPYQGDAKDRLSQSLSQSLRREGVQGEGKPRPPIPPSDEEVFLQGAKIGLARQECLKFLNHYHANGWLVGKNKMKSWHHSLQNWKLNNQPGGVYHSSTNGHSSVQDKNPYAERDLHPKGSPEYNRLDDVITRRLCQ